MNSRYHEVYSSWQADPEAFWMDAARKVDWFTAPQRAFSPQSGLFGRWFEGAVCNTCHNAVDRHVEAGHGDRVALAYDSAVTGTRRNYTYSELLEEVTALAAAMRELGVAKGDRVVIYMPMVPQAVFAMLACARLGAIHSVVFGGFAAAELATRLDDARPKLVVSASCGLEGKRLVEYKPLLDEAIARAAAKPQACLILQRPQHRCELVAGRDVDYEATLATARAAGRPVACVPVAATDPLYILYTSGTTGQPKGVVRDNGGHMVALLWSMENHYGVKPGEVFWAASDVGWVVGHSYICYGPLLHGCTTVLFEGKPVGTPDAGVFWRVIQDHRVAALFVAPTALRAIRKEDPEGALPAVYDLSAFRTLFVAGEKADPATVDWAGHAVGRPVVDHWWQTETGWAITGNPAGLGLLPAKPGSPGVPMPGYAIEVLDDDGHAVAPGTLGNIVVRLPLPPSGFPTLWNADDRYRRSYFEKFAGYYTTADAGMIDADGYVFIMARTDDVINVAGHRLSTGALEEAIAAHPDIAECAVVGINDATKGQTPIAVLVLNDRCVREPGVVEAEAVGLVRSTIGPVAALKLAISVERLPKTRSGKILRSAIKQLSDGDELRIPATIEDPVVLDEIGVALRRRGLGGNAKREETQ